MHTHGDWEVQCKYAMERFQYTRILQYSATTQIQGCVFTRTRDDLHLLLGPLDAMYVLQHAKCVTIPAWEDVEIGLDTFIHRLATCTKAIHSHS